MRVQTIAKRIALDWLGGRAMALALAVLVFGVQCVLAAPVEASPGSAGQDPLPWQSSGDRTVFEVKDHEVLKPVTSGRWRLSGVLEVRFVGRVEPHENSLFPLFGPRVEIQGRFDRVALPDGWFGDL